MKIVLQRVSAASVSVEGQIIGSIGRGYLLLVGVSDTDTEAVVEKMTEKICKLRIFEDENGKTNLSLADVEGSVLVVSQFTLYADCKKGNRPSFAGAGTPKLANALYESMIHMLKERVKKVECGSFGAHMAVELMNDGPFTLVLDSSQM